jgi:phosphatidylglycerol---prolipoprotein diacylglyceryl transferase
VIGAGVKMASGGYPGYGTHLSPSVFPTPLYESLAAFALFGLLWAVRRRIERPLVMFGLYMMVNGVERFWIERIRVNATYDLFGHAVTQAQIISVLMFIGGAVLIAVQLKRAAPIAAAGGGTAGGGAAAPPA